MSLEWLVSLWWETSIILTVIDSNISVFQLSNSHEKLDMLFNLLTCLYP